MSTTMSTTTQAEPIILNGRDVTYDPRTDLIQFSGDEWGSEGASDIQNNLDIVIIKPVVGWAPYTHLARVTSDGFESFALVELGAQQYEILMAEGEPHDEFYGTPLGDWTNVIGLDGNLFDSAAEAEEGVEHLRQFGGDWANAIYAVCPVGEWVTSTQQIMDYSGPRRLPQTEDEYVWARK